jgi:ATP-dependent Clp protease ATP-binding subunit ClpA
MQDEVKRPLGDELLFGALENGGHVVVDIETRDGEEKLAFRFEKKD